MTTTRLKQALVLTALVAAITTTALAAPAQADTVKGVCLTQGSATMDPPPPVVDLNPGPGGAYAFDALQLVCTGVEGTSPWVVQFDVASEGVYTAGVMCGTGQVESTHNAVTDVTVVIAPADPSGVDFEGLAPRMQYTVSFAGFQGVLTWDDPSVNGGQPLGGVAEVTPVGSPDALCGAVEVESVVSVQLESA